MHINRGVDLRGLQFGGFSPGGILQGGYLRHSVSLRHFRTDKAIQCHYGVFYNLCMLSHVWKIPRICLKSCNLLSGLCYHEPIPAPRSEKIELLNDNSRYVGLVVVVVVV